MFTAIWLQRRQSAGLVLGAIVLAAAANTKDEAMPAVIIVFACAGLAALLRGARREGRAAPRSGGVMRVALLGLFLLGMILPWRLWVSSHGLIDTVTPPLPSALSPSYLFHRGQEMSLAATAMLQQINLGWNWFTALFFVVTAVCFLRRVARRAAAFYLATLLALATMLLWLYGTTPLPLSFLLPTSADRTVGLFMSLTPFATAHLLWELLGRPEARPVRAGRTVESFDSDRTVPGPQMQSRRAHDMTARPGVPAWWR
jgi:hypothetical protein